jgi:uncharacterized repeat protein (TIGR01451 family)
MNSHTYQALIRRAQPVLRSVVIVLILLLSLLVQGASPRQAVRADDNASPTVSGLTADFSTLPLSFIPNMGLLDPSIQYYVHGMGGELFFAPGEVTLIVPSSVEENAKRTVRLSFVGANQNPAISTTRTLRGIVNYLYGNDPDQWLTNIPTYAGLTYEQLYPGISLNYDGTQGKLKGTYLVQPGANVDLIRWHYEGVARVQLDPVTQDLRLYLSDAAESADLAELSPAAWQEIGGAQVPVEVRYTIFDDQTMGFTLGSYDPSLALYIDPVIQYANYLGGAGPDEGLGIAVDTTANIYITGRTESDNFPTQSPIYDYNPSAEFPSDAFVTKISMSSSDLIYSTYLGGMGTDSGEDITVDASGNAYVTGQTLSPDFPTTSGAYQEMYGTSGDAFIAKLNARGDTLLYSTYLGGSGSDQAAGIAVDSSGNAYVVGDTGSFNFPIVYALDGHNTYGGGQSDAFVSKLNAGGSVLLFSTYLGGIDKENGNAIATDGTYVFVAGSTESASGFTGITGSYSGAGDAFVAKLTATGTPPMLNYAKYLGGSGLDEAADIAVKAGWAYVTGYTESSDFPEWIPLSSDEGGTDQGGKDAFVTAYTSSGTRFFSTYLGGNLDDKGAGIGLDSDGNIYVAGQTQSSDFPNVNGFQAGLNGLQDAFLTKILTGTSVSLDFSGYIGGGQNDLAFDLAVSPGGSVYLTGDTYSNDFPIPESQINKRQSGGMSDAFVVRVGSKQAEVGVTKFDDVPSVVVGQDLSYTITVTNNIVRDQNGNIVSSNPTTVMLTDPLSPSVAYVSHTTNKGTCSYDAPSRMFSCAFGELAVAEAATVHLTVNVLTRPSGGQIGNTAYVESTEYDPDGSNNSYYQPTTVGYEADLEVTKLADSYRVRQDSDVTFTVTIHNLGPGSASGVHLTDQLPAELTYVSHNASPGTTYDDPVNGTGTGLWTVGSMPANGTVTLTIVAHVGDVGEPPIGTIITNTADNLYLNETDPQPDNNSSTVELRVVTDYPEPGCHPSPTNPDDVICLTP